MADHWVDDGGNNTTGTSWATAYTSNASAISAGKFISGNRIFVGDDHNDPNPGAAKTYVGPTSGLPVTLISADRTDNGAVPAYKVGTGNQLSSLGGAFYLELDGAFSMYGIRIASGNAIYIACDVNERQFYENCRFVLASGSQMNAGVSGTGVDYVNCIIDLTGDGTSNTASAVWQYHYGRHNLIGVTFVNAGFRTGYVFNGEDVSIANVQCSGCDFSGFTQMTALFIGGGPHNMLMANCRTIASPVYSLTAPSPGSVAEFYNCGPSDDPTQMHVSSYSGVVTSTPSVSRTDGATIEEAVVAWLVTTTANCSEASPLHTPWIYGTVSQAGSKTFDVYITNDTGDFTDAEVWLEVQYLGTADEADWTLASDHRSTITTTAVAQTDDTASTWSGGAGGFDTFKQKLSVTATVNETGQFRARVVIGVASIASTRDFYIDPLVTVT